MKKSYIKNEVFSGIIVPLVFLVIGIFARMYFGENAYPVDYDLIDSYDWANIFIRLYGLSTALCIVYNVLIAVLGEKFKIHSQKAWVNYGIITLLLSLIAPVYITAVWREESVCTLIMYVMFFFKWVITFVVSTKLAPRHWDFCPF